MPKIELQTGDGWIALHELVALRVKPLSLRQAAVESGITASTLCRLIQGKEPDMVTLARLIEWLGLPLWMRVR